MVAGFDVPNENVAPYPGLSALDSGDLQAILQVARGTGRYTGLQITPKSPESGIVALSGGNYEIDRIPYTYAGGDISVLEGSANTNGSTALAAHATVHRYDLIVVDASLNAGVIHGDYDLPLFSLGYRVNPVFPEWNPATQMPVGLIIVPPATESLSDEIPASKIVQKELITVKEAFSNLTGTLSVAQGLGKSQLLTGAVGATNYVGGHATGPPTTGTFAVGDFVVSHLGRVWICTAAGTPGTWICPSYNDMITQVTWAHPGTLAVTTEATVPPDSALPWTNDSGRTQTLFAARLRLKTVNVGASVIADLNLDGTTMMTGTKVVIAASASPATTKQTTFSTTAVPDGGILSVNYDQVGSATTEGKGAVFTAWLRG